MNNSSLFECTIAPQNEKTEKTFYIIFKIIKFFFIFLAIIIAFYAFYFSNFMWLAVLLSAIFAIIFQTVQDKFYNYYDYIFCDDEIRISKVVNNKRRRFLTCFKIKDIEKLGFVSGDNYAKLSNNSTYKKIFAKSKILDVTNIYFSINANGERKLIIMAFNKKFLSGVFPKISSKLFDDDFTKLLKEYEKYNLSW